MSFEVNMLTKGLVLAKELTIKNDAALMTNEISKEQYQINCKKIRDTEENIRKELSKLAKVGQ